MSMTPAERMMQRETRVTYGAVPHSLSDDDLPEASWQLRPDEFLLRAEGSHYFHYRKGQGVRVEPGSEADVAEETLWLNGSVYAAVASINGLLPLHASAVAFEDRVIAFSAPAGGGKSTLAAALGKFGIPMFCDDTLVLDPSQAGPISCLPGHKRLKLKGDVVQFTGCCPEEKVSRTIDKFFARPAAGEVGRVLPLGELIFLEESTECEIVPIQGSERFERLQDDHYTAQLFWGARQLDRSERFACLVGLSRHIPMSRFRRPFNLTSFDASLKLIEQYITSKAGRRSAAG